MIQIKTNLQHNCFIQFGIFLAAHIGCIWLTLDIIPFTQYRWLVEIDKQGNVTLYKGLCIDVLNLLADMLGFRYNSMQSLLHTKTLLNHIAGFPLLYTCSNAAGSFHAGRQSIFPEKYIDMKYDLQISNFFFYTLGVNTGWWEIDIHGCYSPVKFAFAPICLCKNNRRIWPHNAASSRDVTDQLWWHHNAKSEKAVLGDNGKMSDRWLFYRNCAFRTLNSVYEI